MHPKLIKNEAEHAEALARIAAVFSAKPGTPEGDELELLVHLVEEYEESKHLIPMPDPVEAIRFRMEQQGLKAADLVPIIGSKSKVSEVLNRKRPLSLSMIRALHNRLGIPAEVLLHESGKALSTVYEGINWADFPLNEMIKRRWFPGFTGRASDLCEQAEERLGPLLFPDGKDCRELAAAARLTMRRGSHVNDHALWAWQARVLALANEMSVAAYDSKSMTREFMRSVIIQSSLPDGPQQARRMLAQSGIAVVILYHLPGTHLDGVATRRKDGHPIIALTLRHDRLDHFWFTLAHELAHIVLHLAKGDGTTFLDMDLDASPMDNPKETGANDLAAEMLIPITEWNSSPVRQRPTDDSIRALAQRLHIHPAIVAGRVRNKKDNYKIFGHLVGSRAVRRMFPANVVGDIA
ncbi:MAG: ImmA/IrrE family metallo-endopeptidase [bacterium]